jgi:ketosteroid isomerase-like protein
MGFRARLLLALAGLVALAVGGYLMYQRFFVTEEDRIRTVIYDVAQAVEKKSSAGMLQHVADEYCDPLLGLKKDEMRVWLIRLFRELDALYVRVLETKVTVEGTRARVIVVASADARPAGHSGRESLLQGEGRGTFDLQFEKRDGRWLLTAAKRPKLRME